MPAAPCFLQIIQRNRPNHPTSGQATAAGRPGKPLARHASYPRYGVGSRVMRAGRTAGPFLGGIAFRSQDPPKSGSQARRGRRPLLSRCKSKPTAEGSRGGHPTTGDAFALRLSRQGPASDQISVRSSLALQHSHRLSRSVERRSGPYFCCRLVARCGAFSRSFTQRTEASPAPFISVR